MPLGLVRKAPVTVSRENRSWVSVASRWQPHPETRYSQPWLGGIPKRNTNSEKRKKKFRTD